MKPFLLLFSVFLIVNSSCRKNKPSTSTNQLPPVTQEGKNTLGFILNGKSWTPQGYNGTANLSLYYDATFSGGVFNLAAYNIIDASSGKRQRITLFGDSIQAAQKINLPNPKKFGVIFRDDEGGCSYDTGDSGTFIASGFFDIQKLDKINRIFAGTFEFVLSKNGCSEVKIINGRFDMKY